jgi:hypothetical protein
MMRTIALLAAVAMLAASPSAAQDTDAPSSVEPSNWSRDRYWPVLLVGAIVAAIVLAVVEDSGSSSPVSP